LTIRLLCGDALEQLRLLADESVDMIFTDPPYGHNNNNNNDLIHRWEAALGLVKSVPDDHARPIANDGVEANELVRAFFAEAKRLLKPGCCCCCCGGGGGPDPQFARWSLWLGEALDFKQMVVWDKGPMGMGWHYRRSYETVLVGMKPGAACKWYDTTHRVENIIRPGGLRAAKILPRSDQHPTQKPVALAGHFIALHSEPGDLVLDPFMGTGSTGIAAEILGRDFIGIDLSPEYIEIARRRIEGTAPLFAERVLRGEEER
jgi:DNA modification methylase